MIIRLLRTMSVVLTWWRKPLQEFIQQRQSAADLQTKPTDLGSRDCPVYRLLSSTPTITICHDENTTNVVLSSQSPNHDRPAELRCRGTISVEHLPAALRRPEMTLHTFKRQLKAYLFHIWCDGEQKEHSPPPGTVVAFSWFWRLI